MKATKIEWDVESLDELEYLPSEVVLSADIADFYDCLQLSADIADWLSDQYGYCVKSFCIHM